MQERSAEQVDRLAAGLLAKPLDSVTDTVDVDVNQHAEVVVVAGYGPFGKHHDLVRPAFVDDGGNGSHVLLDMPADGDLSDDYRRFHLALQ